MSVLILFTTSVRNISRSKKNYARYDQKCILVFVESTHYSCQSLMKLQISWEIFKKYSNIKFQENPSSGSQTVACGWIDGQAREAN